MPTHVLVHLPEGFARVLRWNRAPGLNDFAYRILDALYSKQMKPTVDEVAESFGCARSKASSALRSLVRNGLLRRWRHSYGHSQWEHFYVLTDVPFAWDDDLTLQAKITHLVDQVAARARDLTHPAEWISSRPSHERITPPDDAAPPDAPASVASPVDATSETKHSLDPHVESHAGNSHHKNRAVTSSSLSSGENYPQPPRGQLAHSRKKPDRSRTRRAGSYETRLMRQLNAVPPELEPFITGAVRVLGGITALTPMQRAQHLLVTATALASGLSEPQLHTDLATGYNSAHSVAACMRWRFTRLSNALAAAGWPVPAMARTGPNG